jgi:hypothetical protein
MYLEPGHVPVIEKAVDDDPDTQADLLTCHMRGWVEILRDAVSKIDLTPDGQLPNDLRSTTVAPIYRLTEAGWNVVHRMKMWVLATFLVAVETLVATVAGVIVTVTVSKNSANKVPISALRASEVKH